jgi:hypothetical protein
MNENYMGPVAGAMCDYNEAVESDMGRHADLWYAARAVAYELAILYATTDRPCFKWAHEEAWRLVGEALRRPEATSPTMSEVQYVHFIHDPTEKPSTFCSPFRAHWDGLD